jgi:oligopeptide transport system ATP-binding protein
MPLLSVSDLSTSFFMRSGTVRAVRNVSFELAQGEILGIVGESGCGKSALCLSLMRLIAPPGKIETGSALFGSLDLLHCNNAQMQKIRGNLISMVFQDPLTSLNPYLRVIEQLIEPLRVHQNISKKEALASAIRALTEVGIDNGKIAASSYPHEFSGGMRQRVMIAMALITRPKLLIADEPTTALDVTVQAQILDLIRRLGRSHGMSVIFITHNLGIVAQLCRRVLVMYAGRIVESAMTRDLFYSPLHPYTKALIKSLPSAHLPGETLTVIAGQPPDLSKPLPGCPFAPRCEYAHEECLTSDNILKEVMPGHYTACVRAQRGEIDL